jgi:hypothetical protein
VTKPLIIGESNPYGQDPHFALYPAPDGCSGHRLCCLILGMRRAEYLEAFERVNLCAGSHATLFRWSMPEARKRAQELFCYAGKVILLGSKVANAWGFSPFKPFTIQDGGKILVLPHPSGLCRLWHKPGAFQRARDLVLNLCPELQGKIGVSK